jgi:hypothetical protein
MIPMSYLKIVEHDIETEEWVERGIVPFRGLPRPMGTIEMDKEGVPFLYRVLSVMHPTNGEDGTIMVRELGSCANCLESIYRGGEY